MISISLKRPVTVLMMVMVILVLGYLSYTSLGRDLLPDITYPSLTITTKYEGAAPQEVEEYITKPLESALATVKGKRTISSISREGLSLITIEFQWGEDMQIALLNVREKLDQARFDTGFPQDAERPNILRWDPSAKPIVGLAITGKGTILQLKEGIREIIKPRLEQLEGVAFAQISGDIERVIDVEVDREKLLLYNLSLSQIATAIGNANRNIAGGSIKKGRYRYALRTLGEFEAVNEINSVVVSREGGADILVSDVAVVNDTIKDREAMATVNGQEAIGLLIYKEAGANTIEATRLVTELLDEFARTNKDFKIVVAFEQAKFIEQALNNVWLSLIFGGFFAFIVLTLFLGDLKSPIFIFISIPIAIISTIVLMDFADLSMNIMSLGGLALGVGMLVDNSIVVLENIYRYREKGWTAAKAAYEGAREVGLPVAASTLTTIAVFFPIVYLEGISGALFGEQALTVTFSMVSSLVVSLTVLPLLTLVGSVLKGRDSFPAQVPALPKVESSQYPRNFWFWKWWEYLIAAAAVFLIAGYFKLEYKWSFWLLGGLAVLPLAMFVTKWILTLVISWLLQLLAFSIQLIQKIIMLILNYIALPIFNFLYRGFEKIYHAVLTWALDRKLLCLTLALALLAISVLTVPKLKRELMPRSATGQFSIDAKLAPGTALEITHEVIKDLETFLLEDDAVEVVFSQIGASDANLAQLLKDSGTNTAQISVKLGEDYISLYEVYRISQAVRAWSEDVPGMTVAFKESESSLEDMLAAEGGSGLVIQIEGESFDPMYQASDQIVAALSEMEGFKDIKTTLTRDFPQIEIRMKRDNIDRYGFDMAAVGEFISGGMRGTQSTDYKEFDRNINVRVRFPERDRNNFERVMGAMMSSPEGTSVPLYELLEAEVIQGAKEIRRIDQKRVGLITANLAGKKISEVTPQVEAMLSELVLPPGIQRPRIMGEQKGISDSFNQLGFAFLLSAVLVYMIMAGQFESLKHPFVVIFTVPMGLVGTAFMLYTFDQSINIMSLIGLIVLSGIVVNDAIVKVDFINQARREGASTRDAILEASRVRLRPILMTTATTVLGLIPMATGILFWFVSLDIIQPLILWGDALLLDLGSTTTLSALFSPQGAEIQRPLALVVIGGLSMATLLTLILIPVLYEIFSGKEVAQTEPELHPDSSDSDPPLKLETSEDPT